MINRPITLFFLTLFALNASLLMAQTVVGSIDARAVGAGINYNGSGAQTISNATAYTNQEIRNLTVDNGNLNAAGGSYLNLRGTLSLVNGTYTTAGSLFLYGNVVSTNGKLQSGNNIFGMYGTTGSQSLNTNVFPARTVGRLYIKNTNGVTLAGAATVNNELNLQGGTLTTGGTLTINGTISYTAGNISSGIDTVKFAGTAAQSVPNGTFLSATVARLEVNNSQGISSQGNLIISNAFIGGKLQVSTTALAAPGKTITISGSQLIVKGFNAAPSTGQVYTILSAGTISGTFTSVSLPTGITGVLSYTSNSVQLTIQGTSAGSSMTQTTAKNSEGDATSDLLLFPNPAVDVLNVNHKPAAEGASITIYNGMGVKVYSAAVPRNATQSTVNVQPLQIGYYSLIFSNNGRRYIKAFIK